jgi:hypothetical protein
LTLSQESCRTQAAEIGPATREVVDGLLDHRPEDRLRTAGRVLGLAERFGPQRLETACVRALRFDDPAYRTVKHILEQGLDAEELPSIEPAPPALAFVRSHQMAHVRAGLQSSPAPPSQPRDRKTPHSISSPEDFKIACRET